MSTILHRYSTHFYDRFIIFLFLYRRVVQMSTKVANVPKIPPPSDNNYAVTIVEQGPRDDQARVDGYGGHVKPLMSQYHTSLPKYTDDLFVGFGGAASALASLLNLADLSGLEKIKNVMEELNPDKLLKRIENNVLGGRTIQSIMELPAKFKQDAIGTLSELTKGVNLGGFDLGNLIRTGQMEYENASRIYHMVKNNQWTTLEGLNKAMTQVTRVLGNNQLATMVDLHAVSAFLADSIKTAAEIGDSKLVKDISAMFKDSRQRNAALGTAVYNTASRSDIATLNTIVDVLKGDNISSNYPKVNQIMLSCYKLEPFFDPSMLASHRERLIGVLNKVDKNWGHDTHNGQRVTSLKTFKNISEDAKHLLLNAPEGQEDYRVEMMIANEYPATTLHGLISEMYKNVDLSKLH